MATRTYNDRPMNGNIENINIWIRRHKLFAFSAPIIVSLVVFFVVTSIRSMEDENRSPTKEGAYNNTLPGQKRELMVTEPNDIYKKSQRDSMAALNQRGLFKSILDTKKENDSLERLLEELDNFSFGAREDKDNNGMEDKTGSKPQSTVFVSKKTAAREKLEYRNLLMQARNERLSQSQDYSAPYSETSLKSSPAPITFDAAIYRDQFVLPGDRVTLILRENVFYQGKRFPKNTFVYAVANIQGSRVILEVTNIDNVRMALTALDQEDGMAGLHNQRAGELLHEFKSDARHQGMDELSEAVGESVEMPLAKNLMRSFGNYFTKKKYRQRDKILLVNGDRVFLAPKN
ncbi:hypothetical protein LCGC14_1260980 [marine sediment metagenome]|uniref:Conjugative transposon protein TraM n=2 Tax=root TaxID=1 RepID=A0A831VQ96_9FLAO|nr:conjugative transposon protein TraM [Pricia sp.]HEA23655.1 conjugative transposon protein TraM [Pricia antarctica]